MEKRRLQQRKRGNPLRLKMLLFLFCSCTLLSNCQTPCPPIGRMLARAYQMRAAGAYAHQYAEHGVGDEEFEQAFARVEDVLATYRAL